VSDYKTATSKVTIYRWYIEGKLAGVKIRKCANPGGSVLKERELASPNPQNGGRFDSCSCSQMN